MESIKSREMTSQKYGRHESDYPGICERYMNDIEEYLTSKITGLPVSVYKEIATYAANRFTVSMADIIRDRDMEWNGIMRKSRRTRERKD